MSHTRKVALLFSLAVLAVSAIASSSTPRADAVDPQLNVEPTNVGFTLVKADWCDELCGAECGGECLSSRLQGCTCYWVCEGGDEGHAICTGAIGVKICG